MCGMGEYRLGTEVVVLVLYGSDQLELTVPPDGRMNGQPWTQCMWDDVDLSEAVYVFRFHSTLW